ncbi:MAG: polysulfide reductase NrfD [Saprospiraceae bacterium]|nr:polysulfide reductase NrfD [Saprospiraceae bacterium]
MIKPALLVLTGIVAVVVALYTAFLFAQAKGRDFWQSPALAIHMGVHSLMAGASAYILLGLSGLVDENWMPFLSLTLMVGIVVNLFTILLEMTMTHPTHDAKKTVEMILHGRYKTTFWMLVILVGNVIPFVLLFVDINAFIPAVAVLTGIYFTEKIWVEAPQRIPLV